MKNCDLCNKSISEREMTVIPRNEFQLAVKRGFNPFKTKGINMEIVTSQLKLGGIWTVDEYYPIWSQKALNDSTDWGLCDQCAKNFHSFHSIAPDSAMRIGVQSPMKQEKKWFQFWK